MSTRPVFALLFSCCLNAQAATCWDTLSKGSEVHDKRAAFVAPSIGAHAAGSPWVAWSAHQALQIRRWDGKQWRAMPSPGARDGAYDPVISVAASGAVFLAWREVQHRQSKIVVGAWTGKQWKRLGEPLSAYPDVISDANSAVMITDEQGLPIVAWGEAQDKLTRSVHVARWNGFAWTMMGKSVASRIALYWPEPQIALARDGLWIVWTGGTAERSHAQVARWDGASWIDVGKTGVGHLNRGNYVFGAQIVVPADGRALVAWTDSADKANTLAMSRWTGSRWESVPLASQGHNTRRPSLMLSAQGAPLLAHIDADSTDRTDLSLESLDGNTWQPLAASRRIDHGAGNGRGPTMAMGKGDQVYLAWDESEKKQRIGVVRTRPCRRGELPAAQAESD